MDAAKEQQDAGGVRRRRLIGCGGNPEGNRPRENPILIRNFSKMKKKKNITKQNDNNQSASLELKFMRNVKTQELIESQGLHPASHVRTCTIFSSASCQ